MNLKSCALAARRCSRRLGSAALSTAKPTAAEPHLPVSSPRLAGSWVTRPSDKMRLCAISGWSVHGCGWEQRPTAPRLTKRNSREADLVDPTLLLHPAAGKENKRGRTGQHHAQVDCGAVGMEEEAVVEVEAARRWLPTAEPLVVPPALQAASRPNAYDLHGDARFMRPAAVRGGGGGDAVPADGCMMDAELPNETQVGVRRSYAGGLGGVALGGNESFSSPCPAMLML